MIDEKKVQEWGKQQKKTSYNKFLLRLLDEFDADMPNKTDVGMLLEYFIDFDPVSLRGA